jgi:hypothetical protein
MVGPLYLPPFLVGLATVAIGGLVGLVAPRIRWMPAVGAGFAAILLIGALTFGSAAVEYLLTHHRTDFGFIEDTLQLASETIAIVAGTAATVRAYRRSTSRPPP